MQFCECSKSAPKPPSLSRMGAAPPFRLNENALLTAALAAAVLLPQLGKRPPKWLQLGVTLATGVTLLIALHNAIKPAENAPP